ncbi:hypothetical protein D6C91_09917 [Aureobasidium pullulans]|uniref:Nucleotide-diphospho-sugar transferase n=1 Tax=Aureobasidium pullulans TaxID=5580 RepID=A0A4S9SEK9_AURPU|nr:hypothetical protein D6C91_09917 [Aureobasidium pullulans]
MPLIARSSSSNMSQGPDSMDLVVSRYDESAYSVASYIGPILNMTPLSGLTTRVIICSTGQDEPEDLRDDLRHHLPFNVDVIVRQRPNVGREGAAFLHHITTGWQDLADHTLFMQAELHYSWSVRRRIQDYFVPNTGFLSLSDVSEYCSSWDQCWDHSTWSESPDVLKSIYSRANPTIRQGFTLTYRGQFIASRHRIHSQDKQLFQDLLDEFVNPRSVAHSSGYAEHPWLPGKSDSMDRPLFGYTIERLWGVLMQCSDVQLAYRCPSLLSSAIGSVLHTSTPILQDCQCLDLDTGHSLDNS